MSENTSDKNVPELRTRKFINFRVVPLKIFPVLSNHLTTVYIYYSSCDLTTRLHIHGIQWRPNETIQSELQEMKPRMNEFSTGMNSCEFFIRSFISCGLPCILSKNLYPLWLGWIPGLKIWITFLCGRFFFSKNWNWFS